MNKKLIITIDGPAAAGKGTIAYLLARKYGLLNLDSGACYRAVAWLARKHKVPIDEAYQDAIADLVKRYPIVFTPNADDAGPKSFISVDGQDVTEAIRENEISQIVPIVGAMMPVRTLVGELQHRLATESAHGVVAEGRDTGSVVFPNANIKFYLTASAEVRAQRRHAEMIESGQDRSFDEVYSELQLRDQRDIEREHSALRIPEKAIVVDATNLTIEEVVEQMSAYIDRHLAKRA